MIPHLTALENVMIAQYFHSIEDEKEAKEALVHVGMEHRLHHLPSQLSGGEQQRVCIARALINQPRIILADEPTGNLDKTNEEAVLDIFRKLHSEGRTIVIVTHNPEIGEIGDKIIQISHGEVKY
ncbi:MAG: ABC transporter ATP-binding protein [Candidatus Methanoperedens nitroreducens]|uniref:ABC transporter ATP-binding protein n=2 Tax=Candidatus Methanoperedens TaxID=1392997 RepID=A0A0P7ZGX5_9EURY|nr:MAG: ABC transporter ATP-binding protein [Candidatus Methanoperedens sp. BLZ1]